MPAGSGYIHVFQIATVKHVREMSGCEPGLLLWIKWSVEVMGISSLEEDDEAVRKNDDQNDYHSCLVEAP